MAGQRKIRMRHDRHTEGGDEVSLAYVQRAIEEALEAAGVNEFRQWKERVETELGIMRIMFHDLRDAVGIAYADQGSARSRLNELFEGSLAALSNLDILMRPGDVRLEQRSTVLESLFARYREPRDRQNEAVEADDYDDPIEAMLDPDDDQPRRRRSRGQTLEDALEGTEDQ